MVRDTANYIIYSRFDILASKSIDFQPFNFSFTFKKYDKSIKASGKKKKKEYTYFPLKRTNYSLVYSSIIYDNDLGIKLIE